MAKCTPEQFPKAIEKILEKYQSDVIGATEEIVRDVGRKTAAAVRTSAANVSTGKYASSWTFTVEGRVNPKAIIYSRVPGLPHLIEKGHAKRNGGRVPGKPHVKPVEEAAKEQFVRELSQKLENL